MHTLPDGFHRTRHYGLFANGHRADKIELCRKLPSLPQELNATQGNLQFSASGNFTNCIPKSRCRRIRADLGAGHFRAEYDDVRNIWKEKEACRRVGSGDS